MLLGNFCQLKNSKTNINVLLDLSQLLEARENVLQFRLRQRAIIVHEGNKTQVFLWGLPNIKITTLSRGGKQ